MASDLPAAIRATADAHERVHDDRLSGVFDVRREGVAVLTADPRLLEAVCMAVSSSGRAFGGDELVEAAQAIVVDPPGDRARGRAEGVADAIAALRRRARPDAAILVVVRGGSPGAAAGVRHGDAVADAHRLGAFGCLHLPLVAQELARLLAAAEARVAHTHLADLSGRLDARRHVDSLGPISSGLSHELGSPLAALSMNLEMVVGECGRLAEVEVLLRDVLDGDPARHEKKLAAAARALRTLEASELFDALADARASVVRMRDLLTTMKELVGRAPRTMRIVNLADAVRDARKWVPTRLIEGVTIDELIDEPPVQAVADPSLAAQVIVNLVSNAAQAAGRLPSPRVRLHVYSAGDEAIVSVRDNGPGIPSGAHEKIFEPFYTTRRGQGGMGLGLSLCREYALQMGARLSVWSVPGRGACFRLHLRRAAGT